MRPLINVSGSVVVVEDGSQRTEHQCGSVSAAIDKAVELEAGVNADEVARGVLYDRYVAEGFPVVRRFEETPEDEPVVDPGLTLNPAVALQPEPVLEVEDVEPVPAATVEPAAPVVPAQPERQATVTVDFEWHPDTNRVTIRPTSDGPATIWRAVGDKEPSTFDVDGKGAPRHLKAKPGDRVVLRRGTAEGDEIVTYTVPVVEVDSRPE